MASLVKGRTSKDPLIEQRRQIVAEILASPPVHEKGSAFLYSNAGYVVTGAALERLTATPWEDLVRAQVIVPLDLRSAGFGPPGNGGRRRSTVRTPLPDRLERGRRIRFPRVHSPTIPLSSDRPGRCTSRSTIWPPT